jgi:hypothetical protein
MRRFITRRSATAVGLPARIFSLTEAGARQKPVRGRKLRFNSFPVAGMKSLFFASRLWDR